ncbi:phosphatase PAP2 family protein [Virgibacillus sp. SK37]|uniref:phosphatase PAP2 family protein n=1 Tax=Virgibacillus sp. SK37 TaxID=403957 RepID=UPI0004D170DE|nr:phosphatase PAP2 family protein [Virgibacillus sp. SK37]AIF42714.1 PAP2 family phosphoesterase [Virgibacillus sp. SK37]
MVSKRKYILFIFMVLLLAMIAVWVVKILNGSVPYVDQWTRDLVAQMDETVFYTIARWLTELGSSTFLIPFVIIIALFLWWKYYDWLPPIIFAGGTLGTHLLNQLIKGLVERERPSILIAANAEGHSFPSGHAMISIVCYGLLAYFIAALLKTKRGKIVVHSSLAILIFLIGMSRYVINVHYLTDVVAGFIIGYLCLIALIYIYEGIGRWRSRS